MTDENTILNDNIYKKTNLKNDIHANDTIVEVLGFNFNPETENIKAEKDFREEVILPEDIDFIIPLILVVPGVQTDNIVVLD